MTVTEQIVSIAPADGRVLGTVEVSSPAEVASAIGRARDAQGEWAARGPVNRAGRLVELGRLIGEAAPGLSELVAEEVGKPIVEARGEVARGAQICAYYGGVAYELGGTARRSIDPQVMLLSPPGAGGCGRRHHAVELSGRDPGVEDRPGAGRRVLGGVEAGARGRLVRFAAF